MRVLIVDDEGAKHQKVAQIIKKNDYLKENISIETSLTLSDARELLSKFFYDFLILDLNIAEEIGDLPNLTAGSEFIDDIIEVDTIKKPSNIVILSSNEEAKIQFKEDINKKGFELFNFDVTNTDWEERLVSKLEYQLQCSLQRELIEEQYDVCIITAVDVELNQTYRLWSDWKNVEHQGDSTRYSTTTFIDKNGKERRMLLAQQSEMGMSASTYLSTKLIYQFKPNYLIMVGIAAGTKDDYGFGDIIVPDTIWNYSSGKFLNENERGLKLLPDSKSLHLDARLRDTIYQTNFSEELFRIKKNFSGNTPSTELKIAKGPMACGAAVVSDFEIVKDWVLAHSRKNVGLDMESYGVFYAATNSYVSDTLPICIKSISDFADKQKGDDYQNYSAYTSACFAKMLMESYLPFD
ncbi:phosphorylase family protein [Enterococcus faecalis]|uniref:phosphorylase family protein n=1 Tax=Enterococcus faecalis TaxID=1351 RepID=UPI0035CBC4F8